MKLTRNHLRRLIKEELEIHMAPEDLDDMGSEEAYGMGYNAGRDYDEPRSYVDRTDLSTRFADEAGAKSAALSSASSLSDSLGLSGVDVDDQLLSRIYVALLRMARLAQGRTISGKNKGAVGEFDVEPPSQVDAWFPGEVTPVADAWSGGENIEDPLDHSGFETGESNAGPHVSLASKVGGCSCCSACDQGDPCVG